MVQDWGGLCDALGIKRVMLHYLRKGERNPSADLLRKIIEAERAAGLAPAARPPTSGKSIAGDVQRLEKLDRAELRKAIAIIEQGLAGLKKALGEE